MENAGFVHQMGIVGLSEAEQRQVRGGARGATVRADLRTYIRERRRGYFSRNRLRGYLRNGRSGAYGGPTFTGTRNA